VVRELSLTILDIAMNSIEANATRVVLCIEESLKNNLFRFRIRDNGRGIAEKNAQKVTDPFYTTRTTRSIGMGLALLKQSTDECGGRLDILSSRGKGTTVSAEFKHDHIDRIPLGDIARTVVDLFISSIDVHFCYLHKTDDGFFAFDSYWILARIKEKECTIYKMAEPARKHIDAHLRRIRASNSIAI
jgi:hypothetical protein